jgi:hypothetical protein
MATRTKSDLAIYTKLSPNMTKPRNRPIKRLIPHCMAGDLSVESCLNLSRFMVPDNSNGASCNYAIDSKGRIGLGVEETNRAWCTSNREADMEGISFEIANDGREPDWHMSDAAINAWLDLATDIAAFYGYKKVAYYGRKEKLGAADEMVIQLHRWYSNKECPGDYFVGLIPELVAEINRRLAGGKPVMFESSDADAGGSGVLDEGGKAGDSSGGVTENGKTEFKPYTVRINVSALNVRSGHGTNTNVVKTLVNDKNIYTITEEAEGPGASLWCKLKSGLGWVSKDFVKVV